MNESFKTYCVGGHRFRVAVEEPWHFKELNEEEKAVAERLRRGGDLGVIPVPADKLEDIALNERIAGKDGAKPERWALDFSQYAPFEVEGAEEPLFLLEVRLGVPQWITDSIASGKARRVVTVDEIPPFYYGYVLDGKTFYEYRPAREVIAGFFVIDEDGKTGCYYSAERMGPRTTMFQVNTSLMIFYTFATAPHSTLLLHSSMVRHRGEANLFFGVSGTGKSTHSRLWLEHVRGCDLMNDDNPVIRFRDGRLMAYGSPWSGKTLCYRNVCAPVRALVRLEQAPENRIDRLEALEAYASVVAAASTIRWNSAVMDLIVPTVERVAMNVPCWHLGCRPDAEAVQVCMEAIENL